MHTATVMSTAAPVTVSFSCAGFQGTTLIDFPGRIASILFTGGCNLRCPYCHNGALFTVSDDDLMPAEALREELDKRHDFIDGIVITGGEPSLHPELVAFAREVKDRYGLEIKLDTNGLDPAFIRAMLPYVDYVAVDLKTLPERYYLLGAQAGAGSIRERLRETKMLLTGVTARVEYRTTMYPPVVDGVETLAAMLELVPPSADLYLQRFIPRNAWSEEAQKSASFEPAELEAMALELRRLTGRDRIYLRTYS
ncbi:MAG TPA: anaerobic ribonucleoside-triphosphate reductase activating protein [bacterium]|nr:anaerobic ribonucleoside-triphosphate reductase activating protein [bacterium]